MHISMFIYASQEPIEELAMYRCFSCTRPLFKVNSHKIMISNAYGVSFRDMPPSSMYIEHQCHSCKTVYSILFQ